MKRIIFMMVCLFFTSHSLALPATSKGGHAACLKKEWLEDMIKFVGAGDKGSFSSYLNSNKCVILKKGIRVTVTESPGMLGGKTGFVFQGIKLWTVREALDYGD